MKRMSILATLVATGLLGIAVLAPGSASADVLCQRVAANNDCPTNKTYGVGAEFEGWSYEGWSENVKIYTPIAKVSCKESELGMKVTDAGGTGEFAIPDVDITLFTLRNCSNTASVLTKGYAWIEQLSPTSQLPSFNQVGQRVATKVAWFGGSTQYDCTFEIVGPGTLVGPELKEGYAEFTELRYNSSNSRAKKVAGGFACPNEPTFTATYQFNIDPEPEEGFLPEGIYVTQK